MIGLVLDIETTSKTVSIDPTTGYLRDDCEILEVGYMQVCTKTGKILNYGTLYFYKPYFQIENEAQRVHGLTRQFLEKYEDDFEKNLITLMSLFQQTCVIGKNSDAFDNRFVHQFILKHSQNCLDIMNVVNNMDIKRYDGSRFIYDNRSWSIDLQKRFAPHFRVLYYDMTGEEVKRKGTLSEYIDVTNQWDRVNRIYNSLIKDRETRAHGALYDVVMTYVIWVYMVDKNLME